MYKSILVATDGSETAAEAVRVATGLASALGATLHILTIYRSDGGSARRVPELTMTYPEGIDSRSTAESLVESIASNLRTQGLSVQAHVATGNVADHIVAVADEQQVDLIVVGNKGMQGVRRVLGSVPNAVAHSAPCAVLIAKTT